MQLSNLIKHQLSVDPEIKGLSLDSRKIKEGDLFFAIPGLVLDGRTFIEQAILKGAAAIITTEDARIPETKIPILKVQNIRQTLSKIAALFYKTLPYQMLMVTGTNGKSTVASLVQQLWCASGIKGASIGTLGIQSSFSLPPLPHSFSLTSPDAITLHAILCELRNNHFDHFILEATSIGLDQHRLDNIPLEAAAFTNFSQDHLDYHLDMESYLKAKLILFQKLLPPQKTAILNRDIAEFPLLQSICQKKEHKILSFGKNDESHLRLKNQKPHLKGQELFVSFQKQEFAFDLPLLGEFQAFNLLTAIGFLIATGYSLENIIPFVPQLKNVPGRLERINESNIFVDYSHKPEALKNAITTLRHHTKGRIGLVFGCGGNRDPLKRPIMGDIAQQYADFVIVTDDNPRYENPQSIRHQILLTCPKAVEIPDRKKAIAEGMTWLQPDDILIVAGKGHETGQIIGDQIIPFNDAEIIRELLGKV